MSKEKKQSKLWLMLSVAAILLAVTMVWHFTKQDTASNLSLTASNLSLKDVVENARMWAPEFRSWFGKTAPDMTITDINGKEHSIRDYRGKDVMLVFWATWCMPCIMEIPHLNALKNTLSEEKLAILAISNELPDLVKKFAAQQKINYTVFSTSRDDMPTPFNSITSIPCSFFIDPNGKIKLATIGTLSLGDMEAIIRAVK